MKSINDVCFSFSFSNNDFIVDSNNLILCLTYGSKGYSSFNLVATSRYFITDPLETVKTKFPPHSHLPERGIRLYFLLHVVHLTFCLKNALTLPAISGRK